jgi:hypothetical protein
MATNPRIPERRDVPTLVQQKRKKSAAPLIILGILAAVVILVAIIISLPRTPRPTTAPTGAVVPTQPTGSQVRFSNIHFSAAPVGNQMYVYARLWNAGNTAINGVRVNVLFPSTNLQQPSTVVSNVESFDNGVGRPLAEDPVKPNQSRDVRINIEHVPDGWNHRPPEIAIQDVTGFGNTK